MDEVKPDTNFSTTGIGNWFSDDSSFVLVTLDDKESRIWRENFVPPPPRPVFLEEGVASDGLTTCDLCSWAWQSGSTFGAKVTLERPGDLGWVLTLIIVSLISAVLGAIVMIIVLHCKRRIKGATGTTEAPETANASSTRPPIQTPDEKTASFPDLATPQTATRCNHSVWSWLSKRPTNATPSQLTNYTSSHVENHYTHMEESFNEAAGESLYAELDGDSCAGEDRGGCHNENASYADADAPTSSAPSSAYYSDLSMPDRAYEIVNLNVLSVWDVNVPPSGGAKRLEPINENVSVPSNYV